MKLARLRTSLTMAGALVGALIAGEVCGQSPPADFVVHASPFETTAATPHFSLGYDDLWSEYRGAEIEQDWPAARERGAEGPRRWPLLSVLGRWLDGLFAPLPRHRRHGHCPDCDLAWAAPPLLLDDGLEAVKFPEIPVPVPVPQPLPLPDEPAAPAAEPPAVPAQPVAPVQPIVPAQPLVPRHPPLVPTEPAAPVGPAAPVVPAAPVQPVEREPAAQPVLPQKPPANTIPPRRAIEPAPVEPAPIEAAPVEREPIATDPIAPQPKELGPTFPPVVELAPEPVIPGQTPAAKPPSTQPPSTLPPRNRIPPPQERLPKNRLPRLPYNPLPR